MTVDEALAFVEQRLYTKTGNHLNDTEREVFKGAWSGKTYQEMPIANPAYVERTLAHRLWKKLALALGEPVRKKQLKGILERAWQNRRRLFISYRGHPLDKAIATRVSEKLGLCGYHIFIRDLDEICPTDSAEQGDALTAHIQALEECHCFVLLLSPRTAVSEMVVEQLQQLRQAAGRQGKPLSPRVFIQLEQPQLLPLAHDLRIQLVGAYHWFWKTEDDLEMTLQRLKAILEQDIQALSDLTLEPLSPEAGERLSASQRFLRQPMERGQQPIFHQATAPATAPVLTESLIHPMPAADPEPPQGQVRLDSKFYVERSPYEAQCYEAIGRAGALIRIKAPRQMGKTSLMARILNQAEERGYRAIPISFQQADSEIFQDLGHLLRWFCAFVAQKLKLPHRLDDFWDDIFGSKGNCTSYFKEYLLPTIESPLVLGLDEVDRVFQYPAIADDFFGLLRAWYEEGNYGSGDSELWERLRLVIVHSTEVYLPLDMNQSPFNVGLPVELPELTPDQVTDLVNRYGLNLTPADIKALMALVGGHPYLVKLALYYIAKEHLTLAQLCDLGPTEAGIYGDHLRRHLFSLKQNPELAEAYRAILNADSPLPLDSERMFKLHSLGLVHLQGNGATPSFELYRRYFSDRLDESPPA